MSKQVLGKGLRELGLDVLLSHSSWKEESGWQQLALHLIDPDPEQPRQHFDPEMLEQLAISIQRHGILQPILVMPVNGRYRLIAGERRFRAAQMAGLKVIPALSRELSTQDIRMVALVENIQREDLSPIEQAISMQRLVTDHQLTHQLLAESVGTSRSQVSNLLRLLTLDEVVQQAVSSKAIDMGHARCLVGLDAEEQINWLNVIVKRNLSVRQVEAMMQRQHSEDKPIKACKPSYSVKKKGDWFQLKLNTLSPELVDAVNALIESWDKQ